MSLLERARAKRAERQATHDGYQAMWDEKERSDAARRASFILEAEVSPESLRKVAGERERTCWEFTLEGYDFLVGHYWSYVPGPPGNETFLAVKVGHSGYRGRMPWPPPDEHGGEWTVKGYARIRSLADFADAVEGIAGGKR